MQVIVVLASIPLLAVGLVQILRVLQSWIRGNKDEARLRKPLAYLGLGVILIGLSTQFTNRVDPWHASPWIAVACLILLAIGVPLNMYTGSRIDAASNALTSGLPLTSEQAIAKVKEMDWLYRLERLSVWAIAVLAWILVVYVGLVINFNGVPLEWTVVVVLGTVGILVTQFDIF